jgi:hypothetical protein
MKICPSCNRTYTDEVLNFCLQDGTPLVIDSSPSEATTPSGHPTRDANPPPTQMYRPGPTAPPPPVVQPQYQQPQYSPMPQYTPMPIARQPRSSAIWWILGILAVLVVLGVGAGIVILAIASMSSPPNNNNRYANSNGPNRNLNTRPNANTGNTNSTGPLPASFTDDFSSQKWGTGLSAYGNIFYTNGEYHMKSKENMYFVMYGPTADYDTENARVRITVRSVEGAPAKNGCGLVVHGSQEDKLRGYGFLIINGDTAKYKVIEHKSGTETVLVPPTSSSIIRNGTSTNQLEVRIKGTQMSFYINGQYATSITDTENFRRGRVGFYASDAQEVAFDDLQINR